MNTLHDVLFDTNREELPACGASLIPFSDQALRHAAPAIFATIRDLQPASCSTLQSYRYAWNAWPERGAFSQISTDVRIAARSQTRCSFSRWGLTLKRAIQSMDDARGKRQACRRRLCWSRRLFRCFCSLLLNLVGGCCSVFFSSWSAPYKHLIAFRVACVATISQRAHRLIPRNIRSLPQHGL